MSAELLRRAAERLRGRVARMPEPWRDRPWRVVQTDTESLDGLAVCGQDHADDPSGAYDCCWSSSEGGVGHETVAAYAWLMHPPVALALAEWLDFSGRMRAEMTEAYWRTDYALELARAILREDA